MAKRMFEPERKAAQMTEEARTAEERFEELIGGEYREIFEKRVEEAIREKIEKARQGRRISPEIEDRARRNMENQLSEAKKNYPDFELAKEMENPHFAGLVRAGVDMITAYEVAHKDELITRAMAYAAQRAAKAAAENMEKRGSRVPENGASAPGSFRKKAKTVSEMSRSEREELMRRAMNGERITL